MIQSVLIRSEGDVNGFFTLTDSNGVVTKYWSCDGDGLESEDKNPIPLSQEVEKRLFDLWYSMSKDVELDEELCHYGMFDFQTGDEVISWTSEN